LWWLFAWGFLLGLVGLYLPFLSGVALGFFLLFFVLAGVCWACCFGWLSAFGAFLFLLVLLFFLGASSLWVRPGPACGVLCCSFCGGLVESCLLAPLLYIVITHAVFLSIYIYIAIKKNKKMNV
jgi:hypothetical protein